MFPRSIKEALIVLTISLALFLLGWGVMVMLFLL
jgi:hypothetical protein